MLALQADTISTRIADGSLSRDSFTAFRRAVMETVMPSPLDAAQTAEVASYLDELAALMGDQVDWTRKQGQMQHAMDVVTTFLIAQEAAAKTEAFDE